MFIYIEEKKKQVTEHQYVNKITVTNGQYSMKITNTENVYIIHVLCQSRTPSNSLQYCYHVKLLSFP